MTSYLSTPRSSMTSEPDLSNILPKDATKSTVSTPLGDFKRCSRLIKREKVFLAIGFLNIVGVIVFTSVTMSKSKTDSEDFTYALVILLNILFCVYYLINGVFREKVFELMMLLGSQVFISIYCIADIAVTAQQGKTADPIKIVRLVLVCSATVVLVPLTVYVIKSFGFFQFRIAGASPELQSLYKRLTFFNSITTIDIQLALSVVILVLWKGVNLDLTEKITLGIGVPLIVFWAIFGIFVARQEYKVLMWCFEIFGLAAFAYIGWKAYVVDKHNCFLHPHDGTTLAPGSTTSSSTTYTSPTDSAGSSTTPFYCFPTVKLLAATSISMVLFLISHAITLLCGLLIALWGFGKGLKDNLRERDANIIERMVEDSHSSP